MQILVLNWKDITHPDAGGAEVYIHEVARRWVSLGHQVSFFSAAVPGRPRQECVDGVEVIRVGGRLSVYREARTYYRRHAAGQFDLVIDCVNTRPFGCPDWVGDAPVVALIHQLCREIWFYEMPLPIALLGRLVLEPMWLRKYRNVRTLTVSKSSLRTLTEAGLRDVRLVPVGRGCAVNGNVVKERLPTIIVVGRMTRSKRPEHALAAFRLLRRQIPDLQLWMVGDGPSRAGMQRRSQLPGVTFFGRVTDAERDRLLAKAHVLVVTSVREGWALTVDEAAAMGTPTIGYDRPGLRDSIPLAAGLLVKPNPVALAEALRANLPRWMAQPAPNGWDGGATSWDEVATRLLAQAMAQDG
jgi:glycosyltransferase involved in cell wall biosynthesis